MFMSDNYRSPDQMSCAVFALILLDHLPEKEKNSFYHCNIPVSDENVPCPNQKLLVQGNGQVVTAMTVLLPLPSDLYSPNKTIVLTLHRRCAGFGQAFEYFQGYYYLYI